MPAMIGQGLRIMRGENEREELRAVAHLGDGDGGEGNQKGFHVGTPVRAAWDHGKASTAPAGGLAVGLAMLESPVRHGLAPKYVDVRPGQAGRLLPKTGSFVAVFG